MNKNKLILIIIAGLFLIIIIWVILNLNSWKWKVVNTTKAVADYTVWLYNDDSDWMDQTLLEFKKKNINYQNTTFKVETFSDYEDYTYALTSAFAQGKWPDLYEINNSEKNSILYKYSEWIHPDIINPNDFRKKFQSVFAADLIEVQELEVAEWEEPEKLEYLRGLPIGFETLWIFYNKAKRIKASDFESIGSLNATISSLKDKFPNGIPLALWNGSTVQNVWDIITQFFLLESNILTLQDVTGGKMKSALTSYMLYWDVNEENAYNIRFSDMSSLNKSGLDLFVNNEVFMIVWYPRMLQQIENKWFKRPFLAAEPFPFHNLAWGNTSINYDYLVKNIDSDKQELSDVLFQYLSSDSWAGEYLNNYKYFLPALLSLESDKLEEKVLEDYSITLGDFYNPNHLLQTFDVGVKNLFDREIVNILDTQSNYLEKFSDIQVSILCKSNKYTSLSNLSKSCN